MVEFFSAALGAGAVVVLVGLSAFFSSSETAIFSLDVDWITDQSTTGERGAATLKELRDDPHRLLVTLLVGNNVVNIALSSLITVAVSQFFSAGVAILVTTLSASALILVFGEIMPKSYGLGHAGAWALAVAGPISIIERVLSPLVVPFDLATRRLSALVGGDQDIEEPYTD